MKVFVLVCLVACANANIFDTIGHALGNAVDTVGHGVVDVAHTVEHGVVDAANTVGHGVVDVAVPVVVDTANTVAHGVVDAANTVGGALSNVGGTLDSTFGDVWNVVKDPLATVGKELLIKAGEFALEQGAMMALSALAAGKREVANTESVKAYLATELRAEVQSWLEETKTQILGSKDELHQALNTHDIKTIPTELKQYVSDYVTSVMKGAQSKFVLKQADAAMKNAVSSLESRLNDRLIAAMSKVAHNFA